MLKVIAKKFEGLKRQYVTLSDFLWDFPVNIRSHIDFGSLVFFFLVLEYF